MDSPHEPKTILTQLDQEIINLLPLGSNNRITSPQICSQLCIKSSTLRRQINHLRAEGVPIASDGSGYFIATTPQEISHTITTFNSRIHKMIQARDGLKKAQAQLNAEKVD